MASGGRLAMTNENVVPFIRNRSNSHSPGRGSQEPELLLQKLRDTKRLAKSDQAVLVENLGQFIVQFDPENAKEIARSVLEENEREKRKRYIRFPGERVGRLTRHAASGGSFARIIGGLIDVLVSKNVSRDQAKSEVIRKALWRTSFRPASPFHMPVNKDEADAAQFAADMKTMSDRLADETELADFFALVAKHPIFPNEAWYQWTHTLELKVEHEANQIHEWGWDSDEYEINEWIPWWAPRCLIGHWYIPFKCRRVRVPQDSVPQILAAQKDNSRCYTSEYYDLIEPFINSEHVAPATLFHRLPIWLVILPLPNRLVPCLYAAIHHPGGFYPGQKHFSSDNFLHPYFVASIGTDIGDDAIFLPAADDEEYDTFYVLALQTEISATGSRVDDSIANFKCDLTFASMPDELPEWLQEQPVQRFLKLTADSDVAMSFALAPRQFAGRKGESGDESVFRPAFPHAETPYTGLSHATIAAYLLRDFVSNDGSSIFASLKKDALAKRDAAQTILRDSISGFRKKFEQRFEK